ncbi:phosphotransferase KptA/Tpt1 [Polychytrium aggregatum]|uniref:phosphotransferase KptA/Tpt1 n=1 Tax=Polychytrium aggregatum TaxID=110093 RepID=UPI0022FE67E9|nr:phosphotransferase KptA/Tpt1 [Polychytrium aggregatum]KAI9202578.1 phosphotransferase KptA/Tpt1 [Polychytrium aggregatum]
MSSGASQPSIHASARPGRQDRRARNDDPDVVLSKSMSYVLRHGAEKDGVPIRKDGFVRIEDLLRHKRLRGTTFEKIQQIVEANDKQRFTLKLEESAGGSEWLIKANQGHSLQSIQVDLVELTPDQLPVCIHGTYRNAWGSIVSSGGLSKMGRNHIHFAVGKYGEPGVISGMRASCDVFIYIDVPKAVAAGVRFLQAPNGVVLSDGINGRIPTDFFLTVQDRSGTTLEF